MVIYYKNKAEILWTSGSRGKLRDQFPGDLLKQLYNVYLEVYFL